MILLEEEINRNILLEIKKELDPDVGKSYKTVSYTGSHVGLNEYIPAEIHVYVDLRRNNVSIQSGSSVVFRISLSDPGAIEQTIGKVKEILYWPEEPEEEL